MPMYSTSACQRICLPAHLLASASAAPHLKQGAWQLTPRPVLMDEKASLYSASLRIWPRKFLRLFLRPKPPLRVSNLCMDSSSLTSSSDFLGDGMCAGLAAAVVHDHEPSKSEV
jgi:hypothetical protein